MIVERTIGLSHHLSGAHCKHKKAIIRRTMTCGRISLKVHKPLHFLNVLPPFQRPLGTSKSSSSDLLYCSEGEQTFESKPLSSSFSSSDDDDDDDDEKPSSRTKLLYSGCFL